MVGSICWKKSGRNFFGLFQTDCINSYLKHSCNLLNLKGIIIKTVKTIKQHINFGDEVLENQWRTPSKEKPIQEIQPLKNPYYKRNNYNSLPRKPLQLDFLCNLNKRHVCLPTAVTLELWIRIPMQISRDFLAVPINSLT